MSRANYVVCIPSEGRCEKYDNMFKAFYVAYRYAKEKERAVLYASSPEGDVVYDIHRLDSQSVETVVSVFDREGRYMGTTTGREFPNFSRLAELAFSH